MSPDSHSQRPRGTRGPSLLCLLARMARAGSCPVTLAQTSFVKCCARLGESWEKARRLSAAERGWQLVDREFRTTVLLGATQRGRYIRDRSMIVLAQ